jgi:hypothetical protein
MKPIQSFANLSELISMNASAMPLDCALILISPAFWVERTTNKHNPLNADLSLAW